MSTPRFKNLNSRDRSNVTRVDGETSAIAEELELHAGQVIQERYRIISKLGAGGMGAVYKAEQVTFNKKVAVKVMSTDLSNRALQRFAREAKAAALLDHPNLLKVLDFGLLNEVHPFLIMDYIEGETLASILERSRVPLDTVLTIFKQICLGLAYAHGQGVVHRDIKPSNILISQLGNPDKINATIVDFGIAKVLSEDSKSNNLTRTGEQIGTPIYMSPEQCEGTELDFRSDIYSVGCVLFECLTGTPPYMSESALAIMLKHHSEPTPSLKQASLGETFPDGLERLVSQMLAKKKEQRYQNILDVAIDLDRVKANEPVELGSWRGLAKPSRKSTLQDAMIYAYPALIALTICISIVVMISATQTDRKRSDEKETGELKNQLPEFIGALTSSPNDEAHEGRRPSKLSAGLIGGKDNETNAAMDDAFARLTGTSRPTRERNIDTGRYRSAVDIFSQKNTRFFHLPEKMALGKLFSDTAQIYAYKNGQFALCRSQAGYECPAQGSILIKNFSPLELAVEPYLSTNPELFSAFRSDEIAALNFYTPQLVDDAVIKCATQFPLLTAIRLTTNVITDRGIGTFDECKNLRKLHIGRGTFSPAHFASLKFLKSLDELNVSEFTSLSEIVQHLSGSTHMNNLLISNCHLVHADVPYIANLPNLIHLTIKHESQFNDDDLAKLLDSAKFHETLLSLDLSNTAVTEKSLNKILALPKLYWLVVHAGQLSDAGIRRFKSQPGKTMKIEDSLQDDAQGRKTMKTILDSTLAE